MPVGITDLIVPATKQQIYDLALGIATTLGLPVTSWQPGDETRSQYWVEAEVLALTETIMSGYVASGFLDLAAADSTRYQWLVLLAQQVYGYEAVTATRATTDVRLSNGGGGYYVLAAGDLTFKNTTSGKTYHNTTGGILASGPGTTLDLTVEADESGSDSNAAIGEIDALVTTLLGVTCANAIAAVGSDAELPSSIVDNCRDKLATISHCAPPGAYDYIARQQQYTGLVTVTKSRTYGDSTTGDVTQYIAGPAGPVTPADVAAVLAALIEWATPLCITPSVASATAVVIPINYELWLYDSVGIETSEIETAIADAALQLFALRPIGGDIIGGAVTGSFYRSMLFGMVRALWPSHYIDMEVSAPALDVPIGPNEIPTLGTVTATAIHLEPSLI